jgi:hypothetical protein
MINVEQVINILRTDMKTDQKYSSVLGNVHTLYKFLLCILDNYHLFTETEGNSVFCGPETVDVSRGEAEGNIDGRGSTKHTAFPRSQ